MKPLWIVLAVLALMAMPATAMNFFGASSFCYDQIIDFGPRPIPVGCELVDCCPGCPGPGSLIDWRIRFESEDFESMTLRFENLDPGIQEGLQIEGPATWLSESELLVKPGETLLSGFPNNPEGEVPVAFLEGSPLKSKTASRPGIVEAKSSSAYTIFNIEQFLGPVRVNEFPNKYRLTLCPEPILPPSQPLPFDLIDLDPDTGDRAVILADGRRSNGLLGGTTCVDDELFRADTETGVGNFLSQGNCHEEVIVFSDDNEMRLIENPIWSDPVGNRQRVQMFDRLTPKVSVWLVDGPSTDILPRAAADMARADQIFNSQNCGIGFEWTIHDETHHPLAEELRDGDCGDAETLRNEIGFDPDSLNVYYLRNSSARGWFCFNDTILVAASADNETLAHELGHAFSLAHTNGHLSIPSTNIMASGHLGRDSLTEGQCFRANVNDCSNWPSYLNSSGLRANQPGRAPLPTRCCDHNTTSADCPAVSLDVVPN